MKNKLFSIILLVSLVGSVCAQNGMNAPYSQYGLGQSRQSYFMPLSAATGGIVNTLSGNNLVNPFNPASYAAIEKESFVFDMGFQFDMTTLQDPANSLYDADGNVAYVTVAFPITNWWKTSAGLLPLSNVNYKSENINNLGWGTVKNIYEGTGGINRIYWGHAFNLGKHLSVGFNANYLFGRIDRYITYDFTTTDTATYFMDARRQKCTSLSNFTFDFGMQYFQPIGEDYQLGVGLTFTPHQSIMANDNAMAYTFVSVSGLEYMRDTIFPDYGEDPNYESEMEQPMQIGLGLSLQRNDRWLVAFDASYAPWSGYKYNDKSELFGQTSVVYNDNYRGVLGVQLLGDKGASKYLRRVTYSAGVHYESGKLNLQLSDNNSYKLDEWGLGLGVSLPMRKGRSLLNLSCSYSSFGSMDLLRHNCFTIGLSVSSMESWFVKRKYN